MSPRVTSDLLLVGSIPAASTEDALRAAAVNFAGPRLVFALPDGETGPQSAWVGDERERLVRPNPDIETVKETDSPTGRPRHMYEAQGFRGRPGAGAVHGEHWAAGDAVIPDDVRFQVGLPFPVSALNGLPADFAADYPVAAPGFADLAAREIGRLPAAVPPGDLAIQWDIAYETLDIEGVLPWSGVGAWDRYTDAVDRLPRLVPEGALAGFHVCYGTFPEWPVDEAGDMSVLVRMANYAVAG